MKLNREKFIRALDNVSPGLASKEIIEQSNCFVFKDKKVFSFNDEVSVCYPFDIDFEGVIPAKQLLGILNRSNDEELELTLTGDKLRIKGKTFSANITLSHQIKLPIDSVNIPDTWTKFPDGMLLKFESCQLSVGHDMAKPILTCIHWEDKVVESCDNHRVSRFDTEHDGPAESLCIPGKSLNALIKNYRPVEYSYSPEWIHFKNENGSIYSVRLFSGTYPNMLPILSISSSEQIEFPAGLADVLFRSEVLADVSTPTPEAVIIIKDKKITVSSSSEAGEFTESLDTTSTLEIEFRVYSRLLQGILQHLEKAELDITLGKIKFTSNDGLSHVITVSRV